LLPANERKDSGLNHTAIVITSFYTKLMTPVELLMAPAWFRTTFATLRRADVSNTTVVVGGWPSDVVRWLLCVGCVDLAVVGLWPAVEHTRLSDKSTWFSDLITLVSDPNNLPLVFHCSVGDNLICLQWSFLLARIVDL
jgi:hypothetical protein